MKRVPVIGVLALAGLALCAGCATKKEVTRETTPITNKVNELDDLTARARNRVFRMPRPRLARPISTLLPPVSRPTRHSSWLPPP